MPGREAVPIAFVTLDDGRHVPVHTPDAVVHADRLGLAVYAVEAVTVARTPLLREVAS